MNVRNEQDRRTEELEAEYTTATYELKRYQERFKREAELFCVMPTARNFQNLSNRMYALQGAAARVERACERLNRHTQG